MMISPQNLQKGGYIYSPASNNITFEAKGEATLYVYRRRYEPVAGHSAHTVVGNANDLEWMSYEGWRTAMYRISFHQLMTSDLT